MRFHIGFFLAAIPFLLCSCEKYPYSAGPEYNINADSEYAFIIGDIQGYTRADDTMELYDASLEWIRDHEINGNVRFVLQTGDITENNEEDQWNRFLYHTLDFSKNTKYIVCPGNHDYCWDGNGLISDRSSCLLSRFCRFDNINSSICACYEEGVMDNIVVRNFIHGRRVDIIVLEFGVRPEVLSWIESYVMEHQDTEYILLTHEWLTSEGVRISSGSFAECQFAGNEVCSPERIWTDLVYRHDNILFVVCGHNGFAEQLFTENASGRKVPQFLFNLQYQPGGGNGFVCALEFKSDSDCVAVDIVDTKNGRTLSTPRYSPFSLRNSEDI